MHTQFKLLFKTELRFQNFLHNLCYSKNLIKEIGPQFGQLISAVSFISVAHLSCQIILFDLFVSLWSWLSNHVAQNKLRNKLLPLRSIYVTQNVPVPIVIFPLALCWLNLHWPGDGSTLACSLTCSKVKDNMSISR